MKRFAFPLDRVRAWRVVQAEIEEARLQSLYAELRAMDAREQSMIEDRSRYETALKTSESVTGADLALLDAFEKSVKAECVRLDKARADCRARIAAQIRTVAAKRRDVRLLDQLKERRLAAWRTEAEREVELQAEEAYLAKWAASRCGAGFYPAAGF